MPAELAPQSLRDLRQLGDAYKDAEKGIQKRIRTGVQAAGKPLAERVIKEGAEPMPHGGGLAARLAAARPGITAALGGKTVAISVRIANKQKDAMAGINAGLVRHPAWHTGTWVAQSVPAGTYDAAFKRGAPEATVRVNEEIGKALSEIADAAQ